MKREIRACDVCKAEIPAGRRSFGIRLSLTVSNGHDRCGAVEHNDICSEDCLMKDVAALIRDVESIG